MRSRRAARPRHQPATVSSLSLYPPPLVLSLTVSATCVLLSASFWHGRLCWLLSSWSPGGGRLELELGAPSSICARAPASCHGAAVENARSLRWQRVVMAFARQTSCERDDSHCKKHAASLRLVLEEKNYLEFINLLAFCALLVLARRRRRRPKE